MEFLELGKTGEKIPVIGMGTWKLSKDGISALKTGISLGSNFIDTAEKDFQNSFHTGKY